MRYYVTFPDGAEVAVDVTHLPTGETRVAVDGRTVATDTVVTPARPGYSNVRIDGRVIDLFMESRPGSPEVGVVAHGHRFYARVESERTRAVAARNPHSSEAEGLVTSPMNGRVLKLLVAEGDEVTAGEAVCVVEAMKMENELAADVSGRVTAVFVTAGDTVEAGAKLLRVEA
jgi:biotin carboxyl carrier protein